MFLISDYQYYQYQYIRYYHYNKVTTQELNLSETPLHPREVINVMTIQWYSAYRHCDEVRVREALSE
jgi:hypothetical protein